MFSIIVPSYNRKEEIPALLESLTKQTTYNFDVVIVDDCSKEPVEVTQSYPFAVKVIRNETNQGAAESRNIGARNADNEWLLFLDDDDRFANDKCQKLADVIAEHADVNFVYHPAKCEMVNEGFSYVTNPIEPQEISVERILLANKIGGMPMIGVKKDLFLKIGGLSTALRSLEDYDFLLKLVQAPTFKAYKVAEVFNPTKFEQHYGRNVTKGEIGCTLSHLAVYRQIVEDQNVTENDYALVCEDDALFNSNLSPKTIALLTEKCDADIVLIGQSKIAEFNDVELEINYPTTFSFLRQTIGDVTVAYPYKSYFAGTVAYLIKKSAARAFLKQLEQEKPFWLADDFLLFETQFQINNNVVRPLVVIENPQLVSNLEAIRGSKSNNLVKKLIKYPLKKILAVKKNLGK
jgi:glycosyl transferase, family 25